MRPLLWLLLAFVALTADTAPVVKGKHGESDTEEVSQKCPLMVKILDAVKGIPAASVALTLSKKGTDGEWTHVANGVTDVTGEVHNLTTEQQFPAGVYRVDFDTKAYWKAQGSTPFHETTDVVFEAHAEGHRHYTLALLLSPYSFTTTAVISTHQ